MSFKLMAIVVVRKKMETVRMVCVCLAMSEGEKKEDESVVIFVGRSGGD